MPTLEELRAEVRRRKAERWLDILAGEEPGRVAGRRPRDPDEERLLLELDRARLERLEGDLGIRMRRQRSARGE